MVNQKMSKSVAKLGQLGGSKLEMAGGCGDFFKRRFYMNVSFMWRAHSGQPGVTSGTFKQCCLASGGGF